MELTVSMPVIGVVRSSHRELETTPIQAGLNRAEHGTIEVAEPYRDGLDGLAGFDYAWLLSWLHRPRDPDGRFDRPPGEPRCGWFDQLTIGDASTPEQLA